MDAPQPLESVIANEELSRRRPRHRMQDALDQALRELATQLASSPRQVLQRLADAALELCQSHSAGVSLVESDGARQVFRWQAVSGKWAPLLWTTLPREFSPCGTVLDRKSAQLMILPERHFTPLAQVAPKVHEALLVPFELGGELVGTVWVVSHDEARRFDSEDRRVVAELARFASQVYERLSSLGAQDVAYLSRLSAGRRIATAPRAVVQKRVLIVDDNADNADSLALLLRSMGHEVHVARDGRAALAALARARPQIVLLDIVMPELSGYEVARRIREQLGQGVQIVAISGFGADADRQRALEAGFDQHLVKPVDPAYLKSLLG